MLHACAQAHGQDRRHSSPGQGPALLQGLVVCGVCGRRMTVKYHRRQEALVPDYTCQHECTEHGQAACQRIPGCGIDQAAGELLLELVLPVTLELAFAVQAELQTRLQEVAHLRRQQSDEFSPTTDWSRVKIACVREVC